MPELICIYLIMLLKGMVRSVMRILLLILIFSINRFEKTECIK